MKSLPTSKNFLGLPKRSSAYDTSKVVILSAPYEKTVSYGGGAAKGPAAILSASHYVEFFDDEFFRELCFEVGIAALPPIAFGKRAGKSMLDYLQKQVAKHIDAGKFVVTLGGEHTISTATIMAHAAATPTMSVLHFDAHSDLRHEYSGTPYSHACFMARVAEKRGRWPGFPMSRVVQVGVRAQEKAEFEYAKPLGLSTFYATKIRRGEH